MNGKELILASRRQLVAKLTKERQQLAVLTRRLAITESSFQAAFACAKAVENFIQKRRNVT